MQIQIENLHFNLADLTDYIYCPVSEASKGYVFTGICLSMGGGGRVCSPEGGGVGAWSGGIDHLPSRRPPYPHSPDQTPTPSRKLPTPSDQADQAPTPPRRPPTPPPPPPPKDQTPIRSPKTRYLHPPPKVNAYLYFIAKTPV